MKCFWNEKFGRELDSPTPRPTDRPAAVYHTYILTTLVVYYVCLSTTTMVLRHSTLSAVQETTDNNPLKVLHTRLEKNDQTPKFMRFLASHLHKIVISIKQKRGWDSCFLQLQGIFFSDSDNFNMNCAPCRLSSILLIIWKWDVSRRYILLILCNRWGSILIKRRMYVQAWLQMLLQMNIGTIRN